MGVRLYPNTQDRTTLERLVFLPAGTYDKLDALKAKHKTALDAALEGERYELGYKQWQEIQADHDLATLDGFLTFGWGKVDSRICPDAAGGETDPVKVQEILDHHQVNRYGIPLEEMGGVHWC